MKKISYLLLAALAGASAVSCQNFLSASSPSTVDNDFVFSDFTTAKTVMLGAYNNMCSKYTENFSANLDNIGSDTERASVGIIADLVGAAQLYGGQPAYTVENFNIDGAYKGYYDPIYSCISKCNQVISNILAFDNIDEILASAPNDWSDLLGQAYTLRATMYLDLIRHWGDCIYYTENEVGLDVKELTNRDFILESEIAAVEKAEKWMYAMNENNHLPDQMTRNYADGLIGRLCLTAGGYHTRRTDLGADFYTDINGNVISFDVWGTDPARNAAYGRRSDWKNFFSRAIPYLEKAVNQSAGVVYTTVDPRSDSQGRTYGNPFQYYFDQVNKQVMPDESVFEWAIKEQGGNSRIAYNFGRGSNGGSPAYPPKANAQCCSYPAILYDVFDPMDLRRDVSVNVTGSSGNGVENIYNYSLSNKNTVGIGLNKYDVNRQLNPDARQLYSGINFVFMRQADIILMLAECYAVTGDNGRATTELRKVHDRAFPADVRDQKFNELLASVGGDVYEAVLEERRLEFVGETIRRFDLIRTGKLPEVAVNFRNKLIEQTQQLKEQGYTQYDNGNQFPAFIWTKVLNAKEILGYRLTMQTPAGLADDGSDEYGLLVPGWRGQHDDWAAVAAEDGSNAVIVQDNTNLAIQGLFRYIDPASAEAAELEARGYTKTPWGVLTYAKYDAATDTITPDSSVEAQWSSEFMIGYTDQDLAAKKAPIYLVPMNETTCLTTGLSNGYGFKSPTK